MRQSKFMKRMMVILLGFVLILVSVIQIIQNSGNLGINLVLAGLGVFEIVLSIAMMRLEKKNAEKK